MVASLVDMRHELEMRIQVRTGRRILDLAVEMASEGVTLRGRAASYHMKQLAQEGARELLPFAQLTNAISVS